ncbi:MAG: type III-B CRISPR module-associated protein Cmr3 [Candidatus Reconcilbacillus cellulovorans]|uniref:Type III-B CRISPR module-associated protein Cmr3 n=1 Tax=Candidatus Reconcilbacillus cellulovorans TaxID=1906605 RepID=A0A2A6E171_9BACL|nr:MAG: type III-B CRISPR module-associated protein Cmr3 [Candidatus Reconcilbacillus cellulovorans]
MLFELRPADTFFFRDHRPFAVGEDSAAAGLFPPRPGTVYGALRTAYVLRHSDLETFYAGRDEAVRAWMGTPSEKGRFRLRGVFLKVGDDLLLPVPFDCVVVGKTGDSARRLKLVYEPERAGWASDESAWRLYSNSREKTESAAGMYVRLNDWKRHLFGGDEPMPAVQVYGRLVVREPKIGIALDPATRRARDEMLYRVEMGRFHEEEGRAVSLVAEADDDDAPDFADIPMLRLGGENRPWTLRQLRGSLEVLTATERAEVSRRIRETGIARVVFLTPAIWKRGNRPERFDSETGVWRIDDGLEVRILTAALGRPVVIGGWDMARNRPKPRRNALPAGAVVYVEVKPSLAETFVETAFRRSLSDELSEEGYGRAVVGAAEAVGGVGVEAR